ncbi:Succinate-semialdehyde dehydrogenase [NADP(+)] [Neolecta irregularis DAH-3]|uniref:Succinate-semialdehyde dehydrogenase [NADP(+)] n=1 Tax=Neolecta irregularis (strain DAH-3) TaxID=1198029 RepID=A0A1U7LQ84_NEOID|nr:Succinate-semialdehyde dehydrogenase [NADP(+)] [Neolecta irregularis DAH-3]|eukprot:OLL24681.1 Succinate-semialdehyde dehydrogenase [NADP(+)] [Neolecta irregularis DAH-3]
MSEIITISPVTGNPVCVHKTSNLQDALAASAAAFQSYKTISLGQKKQWLEKFLVLLDQDIDDAAKEISMLMGRPARYCKSEITTMMKRARFLLDIAETSLRDIDAGQEQNINKWIKKVPVGVALIVSTWNYPYLVAINTFFPALLAGNTVLFKVSPQTPLVGERISKLLKRAGLPEAVFTVIHTNTLHELENLVKNDKVSLVCFTGSVAAGRALSKAACDRFISVNLELGGKDPAYIRSDADLAKVVPEVVEGALFNSGQSCCSIERVYVHESIYDTFVGMAKAEIEGYILGDPADESTMLGPVVSQKSADTIRLQIEDAIRQGARSLIPRVHFPKDDGRGTFVAPCLLVNVRNDTKIMQEETFGPVMPVMKVKDDEEAIKHMNDSKYGLTASIWTADEAKAIELCDQVEAGTVFVNRADYPDPSLAWTGWKESGRGATLSILAFDPFVKLKSYHIKRL